MSDRPKFRIKKKNDLESNLPKDSQSTNPTENENVEEPIREQEVHQEIQKEKPISDISRAEKFAQKYQNVEAPKSRIKSTGSSKSFNLKYLWYGLGIIVIAALAYLGIKHMTTSHPIDKMDSVATTNESNTNLIDEILAKNAYITEKDIQRETVDCKRFLRDLKLSSTDSDIMNRRAQSLGIREIQQGDKITIFRDSTFSETIQRIILEPKKDQYNYYSFALDNNLEVTRIKKNVVVKEVSSAAIIERNINYTFNQNKLDYALSYHLEEAFKYSIDFFEVKDGDRFKMIYDREFVENKPGKILRVKALYFEKDGESFFAFGDDYDKKFYNEFGQTLERFFLSSPIEYGAIITSGYGMRKIKLYGVQKMHFGTDYAAEVGTPIVATGDATVVAAGDSGGDSGIFVKLRHNNTFETQYLHMQKVYPGLRRGMKVKQGQTIGYVGMTGSTSGPHVCYRFKKNGQPANPMKENSVKGQGLGSSQKEKFQTLVDKYTRALQKVQYF